MDLSLLAGIEASNGMEFLLTTKCILLCRNCEGSNIHRAQFRR